MPARTTCRSNKQPRITPPCVILLLICPASNARLPEPEFSEIDRTRSTNSLCDKYRWIALLGPSIVLASILAAAIAKETSDCKVLLSLVWFELVWTGRDLEASGFPGVCVTHSCFRSTVNSIARRQVNCEPLSATASQSAPPHIRILSRQADTLAVVRSSTNAT
jgi:hypothetical protein